MESYAPVLDAPDTSANHSSTTKPPAPPPTSYIPMSSADTDAMLNRVNVALARSQRLMESWLPSAAATSSSRSTTTTTTGVPTYIAANEPLIERPERLGVGASLPAEGASGLYTSHNGGLAGLSKQLGLKAPRARVTGKGGTGRKVGDAAAATGEKESSTGQLKSKPDVESEDEEGGRTSAVGRSKQTRRDETGAGRSPREQTSRTKKRGATYLDEMLGVRKRKRDAGKGAVHD